ncbi:lasso peptide biosynthesis PqqD family chaperone [Halalkalibacter alkaliphilus]|uniref:Lasso peptide biosynthesis PqqD family chaperone n=1 Tax=Halalkalibacter alkaliphilus TaxID=2917993 RepID=A0A9X1ZV63_9BACI|nr:lasso peptide biosynthesis PqqD family chaperone [Halalkalibacter alkaliphilus]MCL7746089.1 lasso peptide biosynthesis PqqD family chaperone [Halalkalibacter alkaliphilus]
MIKNQNIINTHVVSQIEGNIVSDMDGEKVMLSIHNGKYYNLGDIGGEIWDSIKEPITIEGLVTKLQAQYDVGKAECEEHVITFLSQLIDEGLVHVEG